MSPFLVLGRFRMDMVEKKSWEHEAAREQSRRGGNLSPWRAS